MDLADTTIFVAIIRESVSLFVLLVLIVLAYRLVDKFGTEFLEVMREISESISDIGSR
jgi:hypothetical protein